MVQTLYGKAQGTHGTIKFRLLVQNLNELRSDYRVLPSKMRPAVKLPEIDSLHAVSIRQNAEISNNILRKKCVY